MLSSFRKTQSFPTPSADDIHDYRDFLTTQGPIVEAETRFLDAAEDLICLSEEEEEEEGEDESDDSDDDDAIATPLPRDPRSSKHAPSDIYHQAAAAATAPTPPKPTSS